MKRTTNKREAKRLSTQSWQIATAQAIKHEDLVSETAWPDCRNVTLHTIIYGSRCMLNVSLASAVNYQVKT